MAESVAPKSVGQSGGDATPQLQGLVGSSGCPLVGGSAPREVYQVRMVCISTINQSSFNIIFIRYFLLFTLLSSLVSNLSILSYLCLLLLLCFHFFMLSSHFSLRFLSPLSIFHFLTTSRRVCARTDRHYFCSCFFLRSPFEFCVTY